MVSVHTDSDVVGDSIPFHRLSWLDFDHVARSDVDPVVVRRLRDAERSRRLLLLRALVDEVSKMPDLTGPFSAPEDAWDLLARVEASSPATFNLMIAHPYTGSWAGYTTRLVHNHVTGVCPLWMHIGHLHALAAAAAVRAGLNFEISVPLWNGCAMLPTLGMARLNATAAHAIAEARGTNGEFEVSVGADRVQLPNRLDQDAPGWWAIRRSTTEVAGQRLSLSLDDVDPYRGLYEPVPPQRLDAAEVSAWGVMLDEAWRLIVEHVPDLAPAMASGLDSLVPRPNVPFRNPSASTGEAFGSALIGRPTDAAALAVTLIHEFQHIIMGGLLHLTPLYTDDPRERFYTPWRDDPRPLSRMLQGIYAFFGVTAFWRALARTPDGNLARRAAFEFACWRWQTWRALDLLRGDAYLTAPGHRFLDGVAARLAAWLDEPISEDMSARAKTLAADHYAGWRIRHVRPHPRTVAELAQAWIDGRPRPPAIRPASDEAPTPVPDGAWSNARADLVRLAVSGADRGAFARLGSTVPGATAADLAYAGDHIADAVRCYNAELTADPDRPASWIGLGLSLAATGTSLAAWSLLHHPELVRAVHRRVRGSTRRIPKPVELASWIGQVAH